MAVQCGKSITFVKFINEKYTQDLFLAIHYYHVVFTGRTRVVGCKIVHIVRLIILIKGYNVTRCWDLRTSMPYVLQENLHIIV